MLSLCYPCASEEDYDAPYFQDIVSAIQSVKRPGAFAAGGSVQLPFPALEIKGIPGKIGLPINQLQVEKVIEKCSRAPFGRGEDTIVDTTVRCTWQLSPSQFSIKNSAWAKELNILVGRVKKELGCDASQDVSCELYKLLLYEPGGFFKPHRDTEKTDGMFGTLVIQLLSDYSGGELVVSHGGKDKVFNFSGIHGCTKYHYAAFYADCQHELRKVKKGYRVCLIYNLLYKGSGSPPAPAEDGLVVRQVVSAMKLWNDRAAKSEGPAMMVYLLEHKYSEASLSFKALKNVDRAVGEAFVSACKEENFDLYLAHVSRNEMWSATRWGRKYTREELCDNSTTASNLITTEDKKAGFTEIDLDEDALVPKDSINLDKPTSTECSEATGNEGATVERWYKWTALVTWPSKRRMSVIGCAQMAVKLRDAVVNPKKPLTAKEKKEWVAFAKELVQLKQPGTSRCNNGRTYHSSSSALILVQSLQALGENGLIHEFLSDKCFSFLESRDFRKHAFNLSLSLGWASIRPSLFTMMTKAEGFSGCVEVLNDLSALSQEAGAGSEELKVLFKELLKIFVDAVVSSKREYSSYSSDGAVTLLKVIRSTRDIVLMSQFLVYLASARFTRFIDDKAFTSQILAIGREMGWKVLQLGLVALFTKMDSSNVNHFCIFLYELASPVNATADQVLLCRSLLKMVINTLSGEKDIEPQTSQCVPWYMGGRQNTSRSEEFMFNFFRLLIILDHCIDDTPPLIDAFLNQPNRYPMATSLIPALKRLRAWCQGEQQARFTSIVLRFITVLERRITVTSSTLDWSVSVSVTCNNVTCIDCKALEAFLKHPAKIQERFSVNQARRSHLEKQLNKLKCGTVHHTERSGSPMTLVVQKTQRVLESKRQSHQLAQQSELSVVKYFRNLCSAPSGSLNEGPVTKKQKMSK